MKNRNIFVWLRQITSLCINIYFVYRVKAGKRNFPLLGYYDHPTNPPNIWKTGGQKGYIFIISQFFISLSLYTHSFRWPGPRVRCSRTKMSEYALWIPAPNKRRREYARLCIYEVGREQGFPWKRNIRGFETSGTQLSTEYVSLIRAWMCNFPIL